MAVDIFDVDNIGSIVRRIVRERGMVRLADFDVKPYKIPDGYQVSVFMFPPVVHIDDLRHVQASIQPIFQEAQRLGFPDNLSTAFLESVLNAHQHGNQNQPNKKVTVAYKITPAFVEIAVMDEGGIIDPELIPFVLRHRESRHKGKGEAINFYEFTRRQHPPGHNGTGTLFMHLYTDKVTYYKSEKGGLVVHLTKYKDK